MGVHEIFNELSKNIIKEIEYHGSMSDYLASKCEYSSAENEEQIIFEIIFLWRDMMNYYAEKYDIKDKPKRQIDTPYELLYEKLIKIDEGASALRLKKLMQEISKYTSP